MRWILTTPACRRSPEFSNTLWPLNIFVSICATRIRPTNSSSAWGSAMCGMCYRPSRPRSPTPSTIPLFQLWTDFRCHQLNTYYAMMQAEIEGANPGVVIATNPTRKSPAATPFGNRELIIRGCWPIWTPRGARKGIPPASLRKAFWSTASGPSRTPPFWARR